MPWNDNDSSMRPHRSRIGQEIPIAAHEDVSMYCCVRELDRIRDISTRASSILRRQNFNAGGAKGTSDAWVQVLVKVKPLHSQVSARGSTDWFPFVANRFRSFRRRSSASGDVSLAAYAARRASSSAALRSSSSLWS